MNIAISMEMTRVLRNTWHAALNHEWYDFFPQDRIIPLCCHSSEIDLQGIDLVILAGGNDMPDIKTWRDNHYAVRDDYECRLIKLAIDRRIPLMGICRGAHFLNYVLGGTHRLMDHPHDNVQTDLISQAEIDLSPMQVTCHHTIQINKLAPEFSPVLTDSHGVVELALSRHYRALGVGWHPERAVNIHTRPYISKLIETL